MCSYLSSFADLQPHLASEVPDDQQEHSAAQPGDHHNTPDFYNIFSPQTLLFMRDATLEGRKMDAYVLLKILKYCTGSQGGIKCGNRGTGFLDSEGSHR